MSEPTLKKSKVATSQKIRAQILQAYQSRTTSEQLKEIYNPILVEDVILIEDTPEETVKAFIKTAKNGNAQKVKEMLKFTSPNLQNKYGWTALTMASQNSNTTSNIETVKALLADPRTDPNLQNNNGWTALMMASRFSNTTSNIETVQALIDDHLTNPNLQTVKNSTALMLASRYSNTDSNVETVKVLLADPRSNPNLQDISGWTALIIASGDSNTTSNVETVRVLLDDTRTNPNLQTNNGWTALMMASLYSNTESNIEAVKALLSDTRTDVNIVNNRGKTALDVCPTEECKRIFQQSKFFKNLQKQGMRGLMKFQEPQEQKLRALPKDVWRLIIRRKIQGEICADLEDKTTLHELLNLAELTMNVPSEVVDEWRDTKTKAEVCEMVSGLISIGAMYSENAMEFLRRRKEVGKAVGIFEQFEAKLKELGIEEFYYDDKGRKRIRNMNEILEELSMAQKE